MKRLFATVFTVLFLVLSLAACGTKKVSDDVLPSGSVVVGQSSAEESKSQDTAQAAKDSVQGAQEPGINDTASAETGENQESVSDTGESQSDSQTYAQHVHAYTVDTIEPDCTSGGYTVYICSCGEQYTDNYTDALGHDFGEWVTVKEPTVSSEGQQEKTCLRCGYTEVQSLPRLENTDDFVQAVVDLVNQERSKEGLSPLTGVTQLHSYAAVRSSELVSRFEHVRPDGSNPLTYVINMGYFRAGENIAYGYATPEAVMNAWMDSPGHRMNILTPEYSYIGIGCYRNGNTLYWTQIFAG